MARKAWSCGILLCVAMLTGCVDRRFVIETDPPGAVVIHNGQPVGATPTDKYFIYYGHHDFTIQKDGYETLQVHQDVPTPWYEYIGLDVFSEILWPWTIHDVRRLHYQLQPLQIPNAQQVGQRGQELRDRAATLQPTEK